MCNAFFQSRVVSAVESEKDWCVAGVHGRLDLCKVVEVDKVQYPVKSTKLVISSCARFHFCASFIALAGLGRSGVCCQAVAQCYQQPRCVQYRKVSANNGAARRRSLTLAEHVRDILETD